MCCVKRTPTSLRHSNLFCHLCFTALPLRFSFFTFCLSIYFVIVVLRFLQERDKQDSEAVSCGLWCLVFLYRIYRVSLSLLFILSLSLLRGAWTCGFLSMEMPDGVWHDKYDNILLKP